MRRECAQTVAQRIVRQKGAGKVFRLRNCNDAVFRRSDMKVLVLGGDGFCGWPTALHLSDAGHDVIVVDNLSRREIDVELEVESLTPIKPLGERIRTWKELRDKDIGFVFLNLAEEYERFLELLRDERPDA